MDMKFDPPKFRGSLNLDLYLEWIPSLDQFFDIKEYPYEKAFLITILKLKKYALLWFENIKR